MRAATILLAVAVILGGCVAAGQTKEDKQRHIQNMRKEVLTDLYEINPSVQQQIAQAPGYAVFSNWNAYLLFPSVGQGYGVVVDNVSGAHTYMKMGSLGGGLGVGVKDFRAVYVFEKRHIWSASSSRASTWAPRPMRQPNPAGKEMRWAVNCCSTASASTS